LLKCEFFVDNNVFLVVRSHSDVVAIVPVNKNINGIDYWHMIQTMTVLESSWTGFSFHLAAFAGATRIPSSARRLKL